MALKVGELYASFGIDTSGVSSGLGAITTQVTDVEAAFTTLGTTMTNVFTNQIVKAGKDALKAGMDFEQSMQEVAAIGGIDTASEAFITLRQTALDFAADTKYTATEVASAMYYMGLAGWNAEEMIAGLPGLLAMGAASGEDLSTVSDILTDDLTGMGDAAADATRYANIFAAASANSNTTIAQMGEAMKYVAPLANSFGFSMEDVSLALGLLANSGIKGSQAGTSLRRMLSNLADPTDKVEYAMEALGLSLDDGAGNAISLYDYMTQLRKVFGNWSETAAFQDTVTALEEFEGSDKSAEALDAAFIELEKVYKHLDKDAFEKWNNNFDSVNATEDDLYDLAGALMAYGNAEEALLQMDQVKYAARLAGVYGMTGLLAIVNTTEEDLLQLKESIDSSSEGEGSAFELMATQMNSLQGDVTLLQSAYESLQISLADIVMPTIREFVQELTGMVNWFRELPEDTQKTTLKLLGFTAAIGPALTLVGTMGTKLRLLAPLLKGMFTPLGFVTSGLLLFGAAALDADGKMGDMLVTISESAAAKIADFGTYLDENIGAISERMGGLAEKISIAIENVVPALMEVALKAMTGFITALGDNADEIIGIGVTLMTALLDSITKAIPDMIPALLDATIDVFTALAGALPGIASSLGQFVGQLVGTLASELLKPETWGKLLKMGWAIVKGVVEGMWNFGKDMISGIWDALIFKSDESYKEIYGEYAEIAKDNELAADWTMAIATNGVNSIDDLERLLDTYDALIDEYDTLPSDFSQYAFLFDKGQRKLLDVVANNKSEDNIAAALLILKDLGYEDLFDALWDEEAYGGWWKETDTIAEMYKHIGINPNTVSSFEEAAEAAADITTYVEKLTDEEAAAYSSLESISKEFFGDDTKAGGGMAKALENGKTAVVAAAESLGSETVNAALKSLTYEEGYAAGWSFVDGIVQAINAALVNVAAAAQAVSSTFKANLSMPVGTESTYGPRATAQTPPALNNAPIILTQDGKVVASINSTYAAHAATQRSQSYALGYGK